jgi:hypothetical protein
MKSKLIKCLVCDKSVRNSLHLIYHPLCYNVRTLRDLNYTKQRKHELAGRTQDKKVLELLSKDTDDIVRGHVAMNPFASIDVLKKLVKDKEIDVRMSTVLNPSVPTFILEIATKDKCDNIAGVAGFKLIEPQIKLELDTITKARGKYKVTLRPKKKHQKRSK